MSTDGAPQSFADRLRAARSLAGLSQEEVARRAGMSSRAYVDLERGKTEPRGRNLVRIAGVLDTTAEELFPAPTATA